MTPEEEQKKRNDEELAHVMRSPKRFAENARVVYLEGHLVLALYVGDAPPELYALTPHHAKRLSQLFAHQVKNYEIQQGVIPTNLDLSVPSPLSQEDLKKPDSDESAPPETEPPVPPSPRKKG